MSTDIEKTPTINCVEPFLVPPSSPTPHSELDTNETETQPATPVTGHSNFNYLRNRTPVLKGRLFREGAQIISPLDLPPLCLPEVLLDDSNEIEIDLEIDGSDDINPFLELDGSPRDENIKYGSTTILPNKKNANQPAIVMEYAAVDRQEMDNEKYDIVEAPIHGLEQARCLEDGLKVYHQIDTTTDIIVNMFNPDTLITQYKLWSLVDAITWDPSESGITQDQFRLLATRCFRCRRYMDKNTADHHQCPVHPIPDDTSDSRELWYRFSRVEGNGLSEEELEYLFVKCQICGKLLTRMAAFYHTHGFF